MTIKLAESARIIMDIYGIGVDLEENARFRARPYQGNRLFYRNIFTPREIGYCLARRGSAAHFAGRFAAKEATVKALGRRLKDLRVIEVVADRTGRPTLKVKGFRRLKFHLSIAHTYEYAVAVVIAQSSV